MKDALAVFVVSENEPGASTLATAYLHHHSEYHPPFDEFWRIPVTALLSRVYLFHGSIIPGCDKKCIFLWHWFFVAKCEFIHWWVLHWYLSMLLCCWVKYPQISPFCLVLRACVVCFLWSNSEIYLRNFKFWVHLMVAFATATHRIRKIRVNCEKSYPHEERKMVFHFCDRL